MKFNQAITSYLKCHHPHYGLLPRFTYNYSVRLIQTRSSVVVVVNNSKTPIMGVDQSLFRTYQEMVYFYMTEKDYWKSIVNKLLLTSAQNNTLEEFQNIDKCFMNKKDIIALSQNSEKRVKLNQLLPSYIATMKNRQVSYQIVPMCDAHCREIFDLHFSISNPSRLSSFEFIHAWLNHFHPNFIYTQQLTCFPKLLQWRCREILSNHHQENNNASKRNDEKDYDGGDDLADKLVHLAFLAGVGKKSFDSHEILNQLATFCDMNNEITYKVMNPFDMAILCECFFKGGIRIEAEKSLSSIATTLCNFLQHTLSQQGQLQPSHHYHHQHFNPFVIISLLKILRQVNFIDGQLLKLLSELILHPLCGEKVRDVRFIINVAGAFSFPGCEKLYSGIFSSASSKVSGAGGDALCIEKILDRMDNLVLNILHQEKKKEEEDEQTTNVGERKSLDFLSRSSSEKKKDAQVSSSSSSSAESGMVVKSRLKDISKWLWISASLGYQIPSPETYIKDLSQRWDKRQFTQKPEHGIDSLLGLAIMNQYPDSSLVSKILQSTDFRSSVKATCSNRYKGRLGLFLTSLRMERASLWNQLSSRDHDQWFEAVRTPFTITESNAWSQSHRKVKPLRVPGIRHDFKPHTQLLNACMDAANQIFSLQDNKPEDAVSRSSFPITTFTEVSKMRDDDKQDSPNNPIKKGGSSSSSARLIALLLDSEMDVPYQRKQRARVYVGYAVPFLFIPGLKIAFPFTRKEVYLEVLDDVGLSSSYHGFKMRLMEKMQYAYVKVTRDEIQDLDSTELMRLLKSRIT